jgi:hypothetical protein
MNLDTSVIKHFDGGARDNCSQLVYIGVFDFRIGSRLPNLRTIL